MEQTPEKIKTLRGSPAERVCLGTGISLLIVLFLLSAGCTETPGPGINASGDPLTRVELTDVGTGTTFSLSSFPDHPVLIQTFTITCPVCMQQQKEITRLHDSGTVPFVMVGLDIDPNGNTAALLSYTKRMGYYGLYAQSPPEMTRLLVDRFGTGILAPSQAPLILLCPDGSATMFPPGVKTADELEKALAGC